MLPSIVKRRTVNIVKSIRWINDLSIHSNNSNNYAGLSLPCPAAGEQSPLNNEKGGIMKHVWSMTNKQLYKKMIDGRKLLYVQLAVWTLLTIMLFFKMPNEQIAGALLLLWFIWAFSMLFGHIVVQRLATCYFIRQENEKINQRRKRNVE